MAGLRDIVNVSIVLLTGGLSVPGFGIPMVLSHSAAWPTERIRFYSDPDGVLADFAASSVEYAATAAIFSQEPRPARVAIGKALNKPTQKYEIAISTVANLTAYSVKVGAGTATFTSDASATNDEIATGLAAAITTLAPSGFTASTTGLAGSLIVQLLGNAAGNWISVENLMPDLLSVAQTHADPGIAADLAAIKLVDNSWYGLITLYNSEALVTAAAAWVEANKKLYIPCVADTKAETDAFTGATDIIKDLYLLAYARTAPVYHRSTAYFPDAAWFGRVLPLDPGSETWKFKTLAGVPAVTFTETQQTNVQSKRGNIYYAIAGRNITSEGLTSSGEFIDTVRFRDWLELRIQTDCFLALSNANKIPYTDEGVAVIEAALRAVLDEGIEVGGIVAGSVTITVPKVATQAPADRAARIFRNIKFRCTLAGAIHKLDPIQGEIII